MSIIGYLCFLSGLLNGKVHLLLSLERKSFYNAEQDLPKLGSYSLTETRREWLSPLMITVERVSLQVFEKHFLSYKIDKRFLKKDLHLKKANKNLQLQVGHGAKVKK